MSSPTSSNMATVQQMDGALPASARKISVSRKESLPTTAPNLRRISRVDSRSHMQAGPSSHHRLSLYPGSRPSIQYGLEGRRRSVALSRTSLSGTTASNKGAAFTIRLQNTYRTGPESEDMFKWANAERIMQSVLTNFLDGETYESRKCSGMVQHLTDVIKARVKEDVPPRYKIVVNVLIAQNCGQTAQVSSRVLWDTSTDTSAKATYKSAHIVAVAMLHAVYLE